MLRDQELRNADLMFSKGVDTCILNDVVAMVLRLEAIP